MVWPSFFQKLPFTPVISGVNGSFLIKHFKVFWSIFVHLFEMMYCAKPFWESASNIFCPIDFVWGVLKNVQVIWCICVPLLKLMGTQNRWFCLEKKLLYWATSGWMHRCEQPQQIRMGFSSWAIWHIEFSTKCLDV